MIAQEFNRLRLAIGLLTRLPVGQLSNFEPSELVRAAKYFPLAGAIVGSAGAIAILVSSALLPDPLPVVIGLATALLISGAFHEDGLADSADGLFGGQTVERRLAIMKDSRIGTFGVLALITVLALKGVSLSTVDALSMSRVMIGAHAAARFFCTAAMWALPYVRPAEQSKYGALSSRVSFQEMLIALALVMAASALALQPATLMFGFAAALCGACLIGLAAKRRIGGITGDILGAIEQMSETLFMIAAVAVIAGPG